MKIIPIFPVASMSGKIPGEHATWHARTNKYGTVFLARNPVRTKPPTEAQKKERLRMKLAILTYSNIVQDEAMLKVWKAGFEQQTRYKTLRSFIIGTIMKRG